MSRSIQIYHSTPSLVGVMQSVPKPSHGYRAKHLVVKVQSKRIEIQVRTAAQHQWALFSEAFADVNGQNLKYGVGEAEALRTLNETSKQCQHLDYVGLRMLQISKEKNTEANVVFLEIHKQLTENVLTWYKNYTDYLTQKSIHDLLH